MKGVVGVNSRIIFSSSQTKQNKKKKTKKKNNKKKKKNKQQNILWVHIRSASYEKSYKKPRDCGETTNRIFYYFTKTELPETWRNKWHLYPVTFDVKMALSD